MSIPNARDTINKIESTYRFYKNINWYFIPLGFLCCWLYYATIYKLNQNNIYCYKVEFIICIGFLIILAPIIHKLNEFIRTRCKNNIFNIAIDYYKLVYIYIEDIGIEKISYFDMMDILQVYRKCLKLYILDKVQLENIEHIVGDLKSKSDL